MHCSSSSYCHCLASLLALRTVSRPNSSAVGRSETGRGNGCVAAAVAAAASAVAANQRAYGQVFHGVSALWSW